MGDKRSFHHLTTNLRGLPGGLAEMKNQELKPKKLRRSQGTAIAFWRRASHHATELAKAKATEGGELEMSGQGDEGDLQARLPFV